MMPNIFSHDKFFDTIGGNDINYLTEEPNINENPEDSEAIETIKEDPAIEDERIYNKLVNSLKKLFRCVHCRKPPTIKTCYCIKIILLMCPTCWDTHHKCDRCGRTKPLPFKPFMAIEWFKHIPQDCVNQEQGCTVKLRYEPMEEHMKKM